MDLTSTWKQADFHEQAQIAQPQIDNLKSGKIEPVFASFISIMNNYADSDLIRPPIPTRSRPGFRFDVGHRSDLKPATIPR